MPSPITIPSSPSHSNPPRKPSYASNTLSARSIGFASDRSPLQKLEFELKHISNEDSNSPSLGRSLSKKQEQRLQRSTTITSRLTTSPSSPSSNKGHPKFEDQERHQHYSDSGSSHHRHRMAHLLGNHHHAKGKSKVTEKDNSYDTPFNTEDIQKPQTTYRTLPVNQPPISSRDRVGPKAHHHHHGYQFQHIRRRGSTSSSSSEGNPVRVAQAGNGKGVFDCMVAHLTLEDRELDYDSVPRGDTAEDDDGMKNLHQEELMSIAPSDTLSHGYPSSPSHPARSPQVRELPNVPTAENSPLYDFPDYYDIGNIIDGHISRPRAAISVEHILPPVIPPHPLTGTTRISQTKESKNSELMLPFIEAIPPRLALARTSFSPPLNVKCGPLLRYTGLRSDGSPSRESTATEERETWRGSVMIVTTDDLSDYSPPPVIRLFVQPVPESGVGDIDEVTTAEVTTMTAAGQLESVRPTKDLPEGKDMSQDEHLLKIIRTTQRITDGESVGKYREVEATKLHAERGVTFWRFIIEVELGDRQTRIAYRINQGPSVAFWVPARGETMNIMFHSCNGFSLSVNPDEFCGPDPLWRDVLREHQKRPFHVMLGGGDQSMFCLKNPGR